MDAIKVIKKHGVPAGVPVITVYVDPNAPGERVTMYGHRITTPGFNLYIITSTSEPFTTASFAKYLYDRGFRDDSTIMAINKTTFSQSGENKVRQQTLLGIFSNNGTQLKQSIKNEYLSVNTNILVLSDATISENFLITFNDDVYEI